MKLRQYLWPTLRVLLMLALGWLLGASVGRAALGASLALALLLVLELVRLVRVLRWLSTDSSAEAPEFEGLWGELVAAIVRLQRRKTHHKQKLARLLQDLRESTAAMPDGVVLLNPQAEIQWFNRTAGVLLGLSGKSDHGLHIDHLVRQPEFVRYLRERQFAHPVLVRHAAELDSFLSLQLAPYGAGQMLLLVRDVTQQSRLEAMRRDFIANASHELRTPLTVISGYLESLTQEEGMDPGLAGPLSEMRRQAQRMNAIVQDLLELSRMESSDEEVRGEPVDILAMLRQLQTDVLARSLHPAQVEVIADSQAQLLGDEAMLHSVLGNLLDNAAKYTPPGGAVSARWWVDAGGAHLAVVDTGIGFASEHIPRLTERFYRVDTGRSRATGGSGLGLAIVKHALQRHGATLEISSVEGKGSRFVCHFPLQRVVMHEQPPAALAL
jgi:two-component system phosphate regulon sensor histidine kinase PhoR